MTKLSFIAALLTVVLLISVCGITAGAVTEEAATAFSFTLPADSSYPVESKCSDKVVSSPETGDGTNLPLCFILLIISSAGIMTTVIVAKTK